MQRMRVVGEVWVHQQVAGLAGHSLKLVAAEPAALAGPSSLDPADPARLAWASLVVAIDPLSARVGQVVLVAFGSGARNVLAAGPANRHLLCDAAIALLVDGEDPSLGVRD
jgi:microcompartment protein CcmK/EutM